MAKYIPEEGDEVVEDLTASAPKKYVQEDGDEVLDEAPAEAPAPVAGVTMNSPMTPNGNAKQPTTGQRLAGGFLEGVPFGLGPAVAGAFGKDVRKPLDDLRETSEGAYATGEIAGDMAGNALLGLATRGYSLTPPAQAL